MLELCRQKALELSTAKKLPKAATASKKAQLYSATPPPPPNPGGGGGGDGFEGGGGGVWRVWKGCLFVWGSVLMAFGGQQVRFGRGGDPWWFRGNQMVFFRFMPGIRDKFPLQ